MKIGIVGAGNIGSTLGKKWFAAGHRIRFGVRNPGDSKYAALRDLGEVVEVGEAVAFGEVILLAVPGSAVPSLAAAHATHLAGKTILDATNNPRSPEMNNLGILAEKAPTARLARAFNTLGWENFATPEIDSVQIDLFFCANPAARLSTESLILDVGLRPVYIGGLDKAAALDGMTRVWFALIFNQGYSRHTAFKLLEEK
jgi:predicted dinucleotide-binding enzyme